MIKVTYYNDETEQQMNVTLEPKPSGAFDCVIQFDPKIDTSGDAVWKSAVDGQIIEKLFTLFTEAK